MQQRQPRLGDILDDYCPRERRVTNHAVVAMIDQEVKQTRCTTCDAEHEYKNAKVPAQRKKKSGTGALYEEVLTGMPRKASPVAPGSADSPRPEPEDEREAVAPAATLVAPLPPPPVAVTAAAAAHDEAQAPPTPRDEVEGPVHRPLIRATLPRQEGQVKDWPIPEFTARTAATSRAGRFRPHGGGGQGQAPQGQSRGRGGPSQSANGSQPGGSRFGRRGPGQFAAAGVPGQGNRPPSAQGDQGHRRRGGRKRSKP